MTTLTSSGHSAVQHPTLLAKVTQAVRQLNRDHGVGDVRHVRLFLDGRIEFDVHARSSSAVRRGRLFDGRVVKALRHQVTIDNHEGVSALLPEIRVTAITRDEMLQAWIFQGADTVSSNDARRPMWKLRDLEGGYAFFAGPATVMDRRDQFSPWQEVEGVSYQFQHNGQWVGSARKDTLDWLAKNGATLVR